MVFEWVRRYSDARRENAAKRQEDDLRVRYEQAWRVKAQDLIGRDGTQVYCDAYANRLTGGDNFKDKPQIQALILEIGDGFFPHFHQQQKDSEAGVNTNTNRRAEFSTAAYARASYLRMQNEGGFDPDTSARLMASIFRRTTKAYNEIAKFSARVPITGLSKSAEEPPFLER